MRNKQWDKSLTWTEMTERDWNNPYRVTAYVEQSVDDYADIIIDEMVDFAELGTKEEIADKFNNHDGDVEDAIRERVWETVDGSAEVIYNYQAKKIAEAYDHDPYNDYSEMTGEKFNSYNEYTFDLLHSLIQDSINEKLCKLA